MLLRLTDDERPIGDVVAIGLDPAIPEYLRDAAVCRIEPGIHNL
jgi:hypothetical protein